MKDLEGKRPRWRETLMEKGPGWKGAAVKRTAQMENKWRRDWEESGSQQRGIFMEREGILVERDLNGEWVEVDTTPKTERTSMEWGRGS